VASVLSEAMANEPIMNSAIAPIEESTLCGYLDQIRHRVEKALSAHLPEVSNDADNSCPARLASAMRYSTLNGGKRLRAILCLMAAEACGGDSEVALPAACALEMVHSYSLIHDDLPAMDNDDLRRGRSTCHRTFDEATAILAGDGLLTLAFAVLASEIKPEVVALRCVAILAEASGAIGMVGGQMADLQAGGCSKTESPKSDCGIASEATRALLTLETIHRRKTGALLRAPLLMGAVIAGASETCIDALDCYGRAIGLAFQIVDDLLDVQGEESKLGKRVGKDSNLGKWTYPKFLGIDGSRRRAQELAEEATLAIEPLGALGDNLKCLALALLERDR
jgi:geranylgeranyl diphosphate synthase, type II